MSSFESSNEEGYIIFLQQITGYIISTILYTRNFFSEDSYFCRDEGTFKLRLLSNEIDNESVKQIINYLKASFMALKQKYLKTLVMEIFENNSTLNHLPIEIYEINYDYTKKYGNKKDIGKILKKLMKNIGRLKPIDSNKQYYLSFKLYYYEITPEDFEPPGFIAFVSTENAIDKNIENSLFYNDSIIADYINMNIKIYSDNLINISKNKRLESIQLNEFI